MHISDVWCLWVGKINVINGYVAGQEPEKVAPSGEETDIMKPKRIQNLGIEQVMFVYNNYT